MTHQLLGEWGFLDNLNDTSGNDIVASANFTPTYIDGPQPGTRAIRLSGPDQTINYGRAGLEPAAETGGVVTMAWMKLFSSHTAFTDIIHKTRSFDSTRHSIDIANNTPFIMSRWRDQIVFAETSKSLSDFTWHHVCNVDSDDRAAWFFDGVQFFSQARTGTSAVVWENLPWVSGDNVDMANTESQANVAFTGIRIFSGTLSNAEVVDWMNTPIVPSTGRSGEPKIWSGSSWDSHPAKVWDGNLWIPSKMQGHDGTDWVPSK